MKISISNIAWDAEYDEEMYAFLEKNSFEGLEIAPTRIWKENPYSHIKEAKEFRNCMEEKYGLQIASMQSIWYGCSERVFGEKKERDKLIDHTKRAFEFADALGCGNLVFGCPKNRNVFEGCAADVQRTAIEFFGELAELAQNNHTVLAMEANPPIYNTNFVNRTEEAVELIKAVDRPGFMLNYDLGTVIYNEEDIADVKKILPLINHVHISEPGLKPVGFESPQKELCRILEEAAYPNFVSVEMGNLNDISKVQALCLNFSSLVRGKQHEVR